MLLAKRVFRVGRFGYWISGQIFDECNMFEGWVRRHFELPKQISRVTISLYSRPSVNREKGKVRGCPCGCGMTCLFFGRTEFDADLDSILRPLKDRTVYLGVEYE